MHNGNWDYGMDGGAWWWIPMMLVMIAFWGAIIWLVVGLIRRPNHGFHSAETGFNAAPPALSPRVPTGQEILAERLARGEIEPDEYRQRMEVLKDTTLSQPDLKSK